MRFSKVKYIYVLLLISLSGLPPFLFFFLKSNFIISVIGSISFYCNVVIFLSFFINMLFYTQIFIQKNYIFDDIEFVDHKVEKYNYKIISKIVCLLIITIFGIIFAPDLFFIMNLFFS
jgi:formate hydrogenlyase subunit 3/multisubunit Na+/H+ antiporter MnhD subunit